MRIAFDAAAMLGPMSKNRGIGNYSSNLFSTMLNLDANNEYYFLNLFEKDFEFNKSFSCNNTLTEINLYSGKNHFLSKNQKYRNVISDIIKKFIKENKIDVFYITSPFEMDVIDYEKEWFGKCKVIAIVYDIIPYVFKSHYLGDDSTYKFYMNRISMLRWVDQIQVISQSVKDDLIKYLGFESDKIEVIWGAADRKFKRINVEEEKWSIVSKKFSISKNYVMCTGGDDERKNLAKLIEAYSDLPKSIQDKYQLVIVCKLSPNAYDRYTALSEKRGTRENVILTNYVSDEELLILYNKATLMAFPSAYEGFGLPIVESWACGTPVLTSNNSSLVQIAGDAAVIVNPKYTHDITKGLLYALEECNLDELISRGEKRLEAFQWEKVALASITGATKYQLNEDICKEHKERIAVFCPLPPLESGIADYSAELIHCLGAYYDIDIFVDDNYKVSEVFEENVRIYTHHMFCEHSNDYKEIVYQMGNSMFHVYMIDYIKRYPGIVVLHDYNLHGVLVHNSLSAQARNYDLYREYLVEDYEEKLVDEYINSVKDGRSGYKLHEWEINGIVTNYAKKIIVHSFGAKKALLEKDINRSVRQIWQGYRTNSETVIDCGALKKKYGFEADDVIIGVFGHIHETKRAVPILHAFSELEKEYSNVKLVFAGKLADEIKNAFYNTINHNRINNVFITGYISLDEFNEYIELTDICLNLRYPYNGETSASLIRNMLAGNVVIVNDIGSFGEMPDDVCIKIPNVEIVSEEQEVQNIYSAMKRCLDDTEWSNLYKIKAREFAEENLSIEKMAKSYYEYIESEKYNSITEEIIESLREDLQGEDKDSVLAMCNTLAWIKE